MKRLLRKGLALPVFAFLLTLSSSALGFSDAYCNITTAEAETTALNDRDWSQLLRTSLDRERNCGRFLTVERVAAAIGSQAQALTELGRHNESINAANRCIKLFPHFSCFIQKGRSLLELGQFDESELALRRGKISVQSLLRSLESERLSSSDIDKREVFDAQRRALFASDVLANSLLDLLDSLRRKKELDVKLKGFKHKSTTSELERGAVTGASKMSPAPQFKVASVSIPLRQRGGVFEVMATINSEVKVFFVVDSGASYVTIPESVASLLADNGSLTKADARGKLKYRFANGEASSGTVVCLRTLDLNGHILKDVDAVVLPGDNVPVLLGQSALGRLGGWSINKKANTLDVTP